ncbi:MAG: GH25 family lysozyme [Pseudomonadota bacterium]
MPYLILCVFISLQVLATAMPLKAQNEPKFRDRDPVAFSPYTPQRFPVHGVDVSRFQKDINWRLVRGAGVKFAFIKATEGGDLLDPKFKENWRAAGAVGIARGAYHFYYFCTDAARQARWFIKNVPRTKGALPPVLDMEWNPFSPTCTTRPPPRTVRAEMKRFLNRVERRYGQRPIIYTTPDFYERNQLGLLKGEEFWLRSVAKTPEAVYPGQAWRFWQYSSTGILPGIAGDVDLNAFGGSSADWAAWLARRVR